MREEAVDLVVVGGGMAGISAAIAAADRGSNVWLIEPSNVLGGQDTAGGVAGFCGDTAKVNHVFDELVARLARHNFIAELNPQADRRMFELEWCAFFLQEMLSERGVKLLLHSRVLDVQADDGVVNELAISSAAEVLKLRPRFVIDATGLCIVPERAGLAVQHDGANRQLPMSLYFTLWDTGKPVKPFLPDGLPQWENDDEIPMTSLHRFDYGKVEVKMKVTGFDAADGLSLSEAEVHARRQMVALIYYLQTRGYRGIKLDQHVLAGVSRQIGIREQRRLVGEHILTEDEVTRGCVFEDAVAIGTYHLDYHWTDRPQRDGTGITTMVEPYHIPLRCMVPKGAKNILVPGRGASAEQMALSSFRVMATVAQMGFAAGAAAAHAMKQGGNIQTIDIKALQADLESSGQCLDLNQYGDYLRQIICTTETVLEADAAIFDLQIDQLENGGFRIVARTERGAITIDRKQGSWGKPVAAEGPINGQRELKIDDKTLVRIEIDDALVEVALLLLDGDGSQYRYRLSEGNGGHAAAAVQTMRGLAVTFADANNRLHFWHGSLQHIREGASID